MVISRPVFFALLAGLITERLCELWLSKRNARRALARGGIELGRGQYGLMVVFHTLFIVACAVEASLRTSYFPRSLSIVALVGEAAAQVLRYWSVATLGEKWNTRVIVIPNTPPVTSGPYRYIRHPNYTAVAIEIACVPLIRGAVITAVACSVLSTLLLRARVRLEEQALGEAYQRAFSERPRFIPSLVR
jgi:methyltransferase